MSRKSAYSCRLGDTVSTDKLALCRLRLFLGVGDGPGAGSPPALRAMLPPPLAAATRPTSLPTSPSFAWRIHQHGRRTICRLRLEAHLRDAPLEPSRH